MRPTGPCWTPSQATRERWAPRRLRPRIEHAQLLHPDDLARFAELGVTASMQPSHAPSDRSARGGGLGRPLRRRLRTRVAERERSRAVLRLRCADRAARPARRRPGRRHARLAGLRGARGRARAGRLLERRRPRTPGRAPPGPAAAGLRGRPRRARARPRHLPAGRDRRDRRRRDDERRPLGARPPALVSSTPARSVSAAA